MMLKCELKKVFTKKINRVILHTNFTSARNLTADRNRWQGTLTGEKLAEIVKLEKDLRQKYADQIPDAEYGKIIQAYDEIQFFIINVLTPDSDWDPEALHRLTDAQAADLYSIYNENIQKMIREYGKTSEQQQFLKKQYEKIKIPFSYKAYVSWDSMIMYGETYGILLAVVIGFLAAGIFAEEFHTHAEAVFFSSKYGRTKATANKILAGLLTATIVYWGGIGIMSLFSFGIMGTSGFDIPYQISRPYSIYAMSWGQYYLLIVLCGYIASLLSASMTMLVTSKMHTASVAICIPFLLFVVSPFIGRALPFRTFFNLTPDQLLNIMHCADAPNIFQIGSIVFRQIPFIMLLYIIIAGVALPFAYRSYHRYGLK